MLRSQRFTSKYLNTNKFLKLVLIDKVVKLLKNKMSKFCFLNLLLLYTDKNFQVHYKLFKINYLDAWLTQTLFQDIIKYYYNTLDQRIKNLDLSIQKSINITYYKKDTKNKHKGDIKLFKLSKQKTILTSFIKYLVYCNLDNLNLKSLIQVLYDYYKSKGFEQRILNLVKQIKCRIKRNIKLIEFTTGAHRKAFNTTGTACTKDGKLKIFNGFIKDLSNILYKHWFKYKLGKEYIYLPVQINLLFSKFDKINKSQYFVKINKHKIDLIGTYECSSPEFKEEQLVVGVDLNIKYNFCSVSNRFSYRL